MSWPSKLVNYLNNNDIPFMVQASPEHLKDSGITSQRKTAFSHTLVTSGSVFLGSFVTGVVFSALPLQIMRPEWQLRMAGVLLSTGLTALLGVLLIVLSQQNSPGSQSPLAPKIRLVQRIAGWVAIGYLILIPAQIASGLRLLGNTANAEKQPRILWGKLRGRILATETEAELRDLLGRLPEPPRLPANLAAPLSKVKQDLISEVDARFAALDTRIERANSERLQSFITEAIRNSIQSLLLAFGFSAIAKQRLQSGPRAYRGIRNLFP